MEPIEYRAALADALVREIKAEMARKRVDSNRELAKLAGASHSSVNDRLSKNTRTGRRTGISVGDLFKYGHALQVEPLELLRRAMDLVADEEAHQAQVADEGGHGDVG